MITLTLPWWGFVLYFTALGMLGQIAGKLGERVGRALYRRVRGRKAERAPRDTIAGS